jgi:hypothetical protein
MQSAQHSTAVLLRRACGTVVWGPERTRLEASMFEALIVDLPGVNGVKAYIEKGRSTHRNGNGVQIRRWRWLSGRVPLHNVGEHDVGDESCCCAALRPPIQPSSTRDR